MQALLDQLKRDIVSQLRLEGLDPESVDNDAPLFGAGMGLDSIDAVELVVMLEKRYGIRLTDLPTAKSAFETVRTLANFILEWRRVAGDCGGS